MNTTPELLLYADVVTVREALDDWQSAQTYFAGVSDPDLVDFAIFWERAARLRYVYLLRCLRKEGCCLTLTDVIQSAVK